MRDLVYYVASTLDGFIAAPDGSYDFFELEADLAAYIGQTWPETIPTGLRGRFGIDGSNPRFDTVVMGRRTYDPALRQGVASPYAHLRQYVLTRSMTAAPAPEVELVAGDPVGFVRELKRRPGADIWLCGGGSLAGQLLPEIDEFVIKLNPVVAGSGIPLLVRDFGPRRLRLVEALPFDSGVVVLRYRRA